MGVTLIQLNSDRVRWVGKLRRPYVDYGESLFCGEGMVSCCGWAELMRTVALVLDSGQQPLCTISGRYQTSSLYQKDWVFTEHFLVMENLNWSWKSCGKVINLIILSNFCASDFSYS